MEDHGGKAAGLRADHTGVSVPPPQDPGNPATWVRTPTCDGNDRHELGMPLRQAVGLALGGLALVALSLHFHRYGHSFTAGIVMLLVPPITRATARWVDGPILLYRRWGRLKRLDLRTVTAVTAKKARSDTVALSAPGLRRPLRLIMRTRRHAMPAAAREHLRRWLQTPDARWNAAAEAVLGDKPVAVSVRRAKVSLALSVGPTLCGVAILIWLAVDHGPSRAIAGAPGYETLIGPNGKTLAIGHPWGLLDCQPVRLSVEASVPDWIYTQAAGVVAQARRDGIDITIETRRFRWQPARLYYAPGQSPGTTRRVGLFASSRTPPKLRHGRPERVQLDWNADLEPNGRHEDLTEADAILWRQTIGSDARLVRRAVRQLIGLTQGVLDSSRADSVFKSGGTIDDFSSADLDAMQVMSGCAAFSPRTG
jgi:hypothetical protein